MPDVDPTLESTVRHHLTRLVDAIPVSPPPSDVPAPSAAPIPPTPRRRRTLAGLTAAAAAAAVVLVVATQDDDRPDPQVESGPVAGRPCEPAVAEDGRIAEGAFPDGDEWGVAEYVGTPDDEWIEGAFGRIDGEDTNGWTNFDRSWPTLVNEGYLTWILGEAAGHRIVFGHVPTATARVEVELADGATVAACPVSLPTVDVVTYFGLAVPDGAEVVEGRALDAQGRTLAEATPPPDPRSSQFDVSLDPDLVPLPLGGERAEVPAQPVPAEVIGGDVPSGHWSFRFGHLGDDVVVRMALPTRVGGPGAEGTIDQLLGADHNWNVDSIDGRYVVWGLTDPSVTTVAITLGDGTSTEAGAVALGEDVPARAFAVALPEAATIIAMEGVSSDNTVVERAQRVVESMEEAEMAAYEPGRGVGILVAPAD